MLVIPKQDIENYPLSSQGKITFDGKTLTKGANFSVKLRDTAIAYCQKYRDAGVFCLLVEDAIQLTVWIESVEPTERSGASESQIDRPPVSSLQISQEKLERLIIKMRDRVFGLDIKDRWYNLKVYPRCFIGSDAVKWLMTNQKLTREEAIRAGQILIERRIIHHVLDEHKFEDGHLFYRFYTDEK
jgi:hypothetical protein